MPSIGRHAGRRRDWKLGVYISTMSMKGRESKLGSWEKFFVSKPGPGDILSPTRLHHLNLSKQCHQLIFKYSNAQLWGTYL